jgi:hypothetical protein
MVTPDRKSFMGLLFFVESTRQGIRLRGVEQLVAHRLAPGGAWARHAGAGVVVDHRG